MAALALSALLAGCGGGDETAATSGAGPTAGAARSGEDGGKPAPGSPEAEGGGDPVRRYGAEISGKERAQAARTLRAYLGALAAGEWARACSQLSAATRKGLERLAAEARKRDGSGPTGCAGIIRTVVAGMSSSALREAAEVRVIGMRAEGTKARLLYEDGKGTPSRISVGRESGEWLVADVLGAPLPPGPDSS